MATVRVESQLVEAGHAIDSNLSKRSNVMALDSRSYLPVARQPIKDARQALSFCSRQFQSIGRTDLARPVFDVRAAGPRRTTQAGEETRCGCSSLA